MPPPPKKAKPEKTAKKTKGKSKAKTGAKTPKGVAKKRGFDMYREEQRPTFVQANHSATPAEIIKGLGAQWRNLDEKEREGYTVAAANFKVVPFASGDPPMAENSSVKMIAAMSSVLTNLMQQQQQAFARNTAPVQVESPQAILGKAAELRKAVHDDEFEEKMENIRRAIKLKELQNTLDSL
jgi:hypothetical protein